MITIPNISIERRHCCGFSDEQVDAWSWEEYQERREHTAFICACQKPLALLVPYDSGVCHQAVDLEELIRQLYWQGGIGCSGDFCPSAGEIIEDLRETASKGVE